MKVSWLPAVAIAGSLVPTAAGQTNANWEIRANSPEGFVEFNPATGLTTVTNGVTIIYQDVVLSADRATADQKTGEVTAEGAVTLKGRDHLWTGDQIRYNFNTGVIQSDLFRTGHDPFFLAGQGLSADPSNHVYSVTNAFVTTDNYAQPLHRIRARQIKFVPNEYVEARNATLLLGDVPVFYFPYYRRSLGEHPNNFSFTPGFRSLYGPYLLSTYNWYANEHLDGAVHLDLRERRGVGAGPDFDYHLGWLGEGAFRYYFLKDEDPGLDQNLRPLPDHRQRLSFTHQALLHTNLIFKAVVRYQSDPAVVRDFFESEYRKNVQPNTFVELEQLWPDWSLNVLGQPRVNDFFETVERLPDIKLSAFRQQLGISPFFYEGENSAGYFRRRFADEARPDYAAYRADTFHQLTLPLTFFGWLNFVPRAGGRFTYYTAADGAGASTDERKRGVFNTGAEISFKAAKIWPEARSQFFDVTELRHIIEPSINYVFVPRPTRRPDELPQFDYEVPSLRLLPIEFPEYNAIDAIDSQNVLRFTLLNKLQTKRSEGVENVVNWALYTDWRLRPRAGQETFSDFYSDLGLRPRSWFTFSSQTRFDLGRGRWKEANHRAIVQPNSTWSVSVGHRYLADDAILGPVSGHNLIYDRLYYRFNENWGARISHYFEARDGTMEEQYYTLYRDLRNWTSAVTFRHRQSRLGRPDDYTIAITFSLKALPRYPLDADADRPSLLVGG